VDNPKESDEGQAEDDEEPDVGLELDTIRRERKSHHEAHGRQQEQLEDAPRETH